MDLNRLKYCLYNLRDWREWIPTSWKETLLSLLLFGTSSAVACTKFPEPAPVPQPTPPSQPITPPAPIKDSPPEIIDYHLPPEIDAEDEFEVTAKVTDDYGIKEVYVDFGNGRTIRTKMELVQGEYKARLKLPSRGEYWSSVLAIDTSDQSTIRKDKKIRVYYDGDGLTLEQERKLGTDPDKPNPNLKYAMDKELFPAYVNLEQINPTDEDGKQDEKERLALDTAWEITQFKIAEDAKKSNIGYLLSKPSEFLDVYSSLKTVSDNTGLKNYLQRTDPFTRVIEIEIVPDANTTLKNYLQRGIDDEAVKYLSFLGKSADEEFAQEALINKLGIDLPEEMRSRFLLEPEKNRAEVLNYLYSEIGKIDGELATELKAVSDYGKKKYNESMPIEVWEDWLYIVRNNKAEEVFGTMIESMLNEGIKEKRKVWTPGQAADWILQHVEPEYLEREKPWEAYFCGLAKYPTVVRRYRDFPLTRFIAYAWNESPKSNKNYLTAKPATRASDENIYESDKWDDFEEVTDRLNSVELLSVYFGGGNIKGETTPSIRQTPFQTFEKKSGDCLDFSNFDLYCLIKNGYRYDNFDQYENHVAVILGVIYDPTKYGHAVLLYKKDNSFYELDGHSITGPHYTLEEAVRSVKSDWKYYEFLDENYRSTKKVYR